MFATIADKAECGYCVSVVCNLLIAFVHHAQWCRSDWLRTSIMTSEARIQPKRVQTISDLEHVPPEASLVLK